jgi:small subunit ribosomal protein S2e
MAQRRGLIFAKIFFVCLQRYYLGNKIGNPYAIPWKMASHCGFVLVPQILSPGGAGNISAPVPKKLLLMAAVHNYSPSVRVCSAIPGKFTKAVIDTIRVTYSYLISNLHMNNIPYISL